MLFRISGLRRKAALLGISKMDIGPHGGRVEFREDSQADPQALIALIAGQPEHYRMSGPLKLIVEQELESGAERVELAGNLLSKLEAHNET